MSMSKGFIKLNRSEDTLELLLNEPNAFLLLSLIAFRARRNDRFNVKNLGPGEALIGDDGSCGLTSQMYRTAKEKLEKWNFATFKTTNRGTIAKIVDTRVWDINCEDAINQNNKLENTQATSKQQANNKLATTNKEVKKERREEKELPSPNPLKGEDAASPLVGGNGKRKSGYRYPNEISQLAMKLHQQTIDDKIPISADWIMLYLDHVDHKIVRSALADIAEAKRNKTGSVINPTGVFKHRMAEYYIPGEENGKIISIKEA